MNTCLPFNPSHQQFEVYAAAADRVNVGIAILNSDSAIIFWNQWLKEKSGLCCEETIGHSFCRHFQSWKEVV